MKIIAIGDIHGRADWKRIVSGETFDKVVFVGDYFDTRDGISPTQQKDNFREILEFKKANPDKVVLLFGNHDYHYLKGVEETYSGFQMWQKTDIQELLHPAIDAGLIQMCFVWENLLFSHAGVTKTWCANNGITGDYETSINDLFRFKPLSFRFTSGKNGCNYGDDVEQSPIWVRPESLFEDMIDGYVQVVGHTTQDWIELSEDVVLIDTLGTSGEYLIWDDYKLSARTTPPDPSKTKLKE